MNGWDIAKVMVAEKTHKFIWKDDIFTKLQTSCTEAVAVQGVEFLTPPLLLKNQETKQKQGEKRNVNRYSFSAGNQGPGDRKWINDFQKTLIFDTLTAAAKENDEEKNPQQNQNAEEP